MGRGPQGAAGQGEGGDTRTRRPQRRAPPAADGQGGEGLRVRGARREGEPARPVRRPRPAHRRPLHVRPELGGRVPELHRRRPGDVGGPARAPPHARHDARVRVAGAAGEAREVQGEDGLDVPLVLGVRQRLQLRLPRHTRRVGDAGRVQLPDPRGARAAREPDRGRAPADGGTGTEPLPPGGRRRVPHVLGVRPRARVSRRLVLPARRDRARPSGGVGGAEGARRAPRAVRPPTSRHRPDSTIGPAWPSPRNSRSRTPPTGVR